MDWQDFMNGVEGDIAVLAAEIPDTARGFAAMGRAAKAEGALDLRTKEFMALGIAIATRCDSCIGFHVRALVGLGVSRAEFCEALAMATYMGGGPSYAYSAKALRAYDCFAG
ncbi:MAG: carboxymuconolactone decarboxylase family protein [Rhodobacteraceae bacterium]|nr:carboxymuconolactone decarboxylase family protein [Paracoccaceae bacterium]